MLESYGKNTTNISISRLNYDKPLQEFIDMCELFKKREENLLTLKVILSF